MKLIQRVKIAHTDTFFCVKNISSYHLKVDDYSHFFYFLRDQNSQHFNKDLLGVNASVFSFVLCFKSTDYSGADNYIISANWTAVENFWWNFSMIRMFSRETITDVHWYLDCLNFNYCPVGISNKTHLSTSKVFRANCLSNFKSQTNTADKRVLLS